MAAPSSIVVSFRAFVNCKNCVEISENNDLAICTDDGFYILEHRYDASFTDSAPHFEKTFVPRSDLANTHEDSLSLKQSKQVLTEEELQSAVLNKTVIPSSLSQSCHKTLCGVTWSPNDAGPLHRCLLAGLSHDHRLTIYISKHTDNFTLLCELSEIYSEYCKKHKKNCDDPTLHKIKEKAYKLAAVEISWSKTLEIKSEKFSILASAMKNGDIVLWKVKHPVKSSDDFAIHSVTSTGVHNPTALSWLGLELNNNTAYLAIGYDNGIILILNIDNENISNPQIYQTIVYNDEDLIPVSCLCWKIESNDRLILVSTKAEYVLTHILYLQEKILDITETAFSQGTHTLDATALSCHEGEIILSSNDGTSSLVNIQHDDSGCVIEFKAIVGVKHKYNVPWKCHGGCLTSNGVFYISVYSPAEFYDHLKNKFPLSIHMIPIKEFQPTALPVLVSSKEVDLLYGGDILDLVRRNLYYDISVAEKTYIEYNKLYSKILDQHSTPVLQSIRYLLMVISTIAPDKKDEEFDDSEIPEKSEIIKEVMKVTCYILLHYIKKAVDKSSTVQLSEKDKLCINMMLKWVQVNFPGQDILIQKLSRLKSDDDTYLCSVCGENSDVSVISLKCSNDHEFGLCCKSFQPCTDLDLISCQVCRATFLSLSQLEEYNCLPGELIRCTLCSSLLTS